MVDRHRPRRHPDRLCHRRRQPQRFHPARTTLKTIADRGLIADIETLHLARSYDSAATIEPCHRLGLTNVVCAKKRKPGEPKNTKKVHTLGLRWSVERTNS